MRRQHLQMAVFPVLEASLFAAAAVAMPVSVPLGLFLAALSALSLNFSLHITYHFHVHFKTGVGVVDALLQGLFSILMGLPFHFYQMLHVNHHIHDNGLGDFTSTWKVVDGHRVRRHALPYSLLWLFRGRARAQVEAATRAGYLTPAQRRRIGREALVILVFVALLAWIDWWLVALYYGVFYLGWSLIALHNYGQHLPHPHDLEIGNSFYNRLYNRVFVNNGLHYEHHKEPRLPYWALRDLREENTPNEWAHTVDGIRFGVTEAGPARDPRPRSPEGGAPSGARGVGPGT